MEKDVRLTKEEWEKLKKENPALWLEKYRHFMYKNEVCPCQECPENRDMDGDGRFPCGQYRCWVAAHRG